MKSAKKRAKALGLGDRFEEIEANYAAADRVLGRLVKAIPSSKVIGDLTLALVGAGARADEFATGPAQFDIPHSVVGFCAANSATPRWLAGATAHQSAGWAIGGQVSTGSEPGQTIATIEAMKTEAAISAHNGGCRTLRLPPIFTLLLPFSGICNKYPWESLCSGR